MKFISAVWRNVYNAIAYLTEVEMVRFTVTAWAKRTVILAAGIAAGCLPKEFPAEPPQVAAQYLDPDCQVKEIVRTPEGGLKMYSPSGKQFIVNRKDKSGVYQLYIGRTGKRGLSCISCTARPNSPAADRNKLQPRWHPSGEWLAVAGERQKFNPPPFANDEIIEGLMQSGLWVDIYVTKPDGSEWYRLSDFANTEADGYTGVAFTPDGKQGVWAQIVDGNVFANTFGRWELIVADFVVNAKGKARFTNHRNITPKGARWVEVGTFAPDGKLLISSDIGIEKAEGMDQFLLDIKTGRVRNLTNSPKLWDEHGVFSPDGRKVTFMSSYSFRKSKDWHTPLFLKTEYMIMNRDGTGLQQLTNFNSPNFSESNPPDKPRSVAANGMWHPDGRGLTVLNLFFPAYETWDIKFAGNCGGKFR